MTQALRLAFDDCISKHAAGQLSELAKFSRGAVEIAHLATLNCEGKRDDEWVPEIAAAGYVVITADRGKKPSRGGKLPAVCRRNGVTHIMLNGTVHAMNQFDKIRAILSVWPKIVAASVGPKGAGYVLKKLSASGFDLTSAGPAPDEANSSVRTSQAMLSDSSGAPLADAKPPLLEGQQPSAPRLRHIDIPDRSG